jgi:predicted metal-binding membrane protein
MNLTGVTAEQSSEKLSSVSSTSPTLDAVVGVRTPGERAVIALAFVVFTIAAALTLYFVHGMRGGMAMPGGWTMSMMWMTMPGQTVLEAAALFVAMWVAMMVAMMLPSALPMLIIYRRVTFSRGERSCTAQSWLVGIGYFTSWTLVGIMAYAAGTGVAQLSMASPWMSRLIPFASGAALVVGGAWQFTPWKFACLKHCRDPIHLLVRYLDRRKRGAFAFGLHHGAYCAGCCWGLMLMMLALGVMNLAAMILVGAIIAAEKLLARGELVARIAGAVAIFAGAWLAAHALFG